MQVIHSQLRLADLPSHNNVAQPFRRQADNCRQVRSAPVASNKSQYQHRQEPATPRILVNDVPASYPTSTVHKSLLGSKRINWDCQSTSPSSKENLAHKLASSAAGQQSRDERAWSCSASSSPSWSHSSMGFNQGPASNEVLMRPEASDSRTGAPKFEEHEAQTGRPAEEWPQQRAGQQQAQAYSCPVAQKARREQMPARSLKTGSSVLPDSKRDEFRWNQKLERASIAHQNYRTIPIVMPKPKALHDLAVDNYMRFGQDPTFELAQSRAHSSKVQRNHERKIQAAIAQLSGSVSPMAASTAAPTPATTPSRVSRVARRADDRHHDSCRALLLSDGRQTT